MNIYKYNLWYSKRRVLLWGLMTFDGKFINYNLRIVFVLLNLLSPLAFDSQSKGDYIIIPFMLGQ